MILERMRIIARYLTYDMKLILGQADTNGMISLPIEEEAHRQLHERLTKLFMQYNPGDRDYVRGLYLRTGRRPPSEGSMAYQAARWATEAVIMIEKLKNCDLPPDAFIPLIKPSEIDYYYERIQEYCRWLYSHDIREQARPLPFFYQIAAEWGIRLHKRQAASAVAEVPILQYRWSTPEPESNLPGIGLRPVALAIPLSP